MSLDNVYIRSREERGWFNYHSCNNGGCRLMVDLFHQSYSSIGTLLYDEGVEGG